MKIINILTSGMSTANSCAFVIPLIKNKENLKEHGIKINFHKYINHKLFDCNFSKTFSDLEYEKVLNFIFLHSLSIIFAPVNLLGKISQSSAVIVTPQNIFLLLDKEFIKAISCFSFFGFFHK